MFKKLLKGFPGCPMVKTPGSQCRRADFVHARLEGHERTQTTSLQAATSRFRVQRGVSGGYWAEGTLKTLKRERAPSCGHFWSSRREVGHVSVFCSNSVSGLQQSRKKKKNPESSVVSAGFPRWLSGKESAYNAGDVNSIPGSGTLEKEMATRSSILAWEILWTEEPGRLQSPVTKSWTQLSN